MTKITFFMLLQLCFISASAQGHLTIFSEDGDPFYLILNGERINETAQTNLRVEDLPQPYYNAKVVFEDQSKKDLSVNNLEITDMDGVYMDVTYKIKRDKNDSKKMKIKFFSMIDVVPDFKVPPRMVVMNYQQPRPSTTLVTQHTTAIPATGGIQMGASVPGMNVNISIQEPAISQTVTQTTTTTYSGNDDLQAPSTACRPGRAMTATNFSAAIASLEKQKFEDSKLKAATQIAKSNCLTADQIAAVCRSFKFEDNKLEFAKQAYSSCVEPQNYFKVNDVFTYSDSVDALTSFVSGN